jgi:hypothetical protein
VGGKDSLNLGTVAGVGDEKLEVFLHFLLGEVVHTVELFPELFLKRHRALVSELNSVEAHSAKNTHSSLEASVVLKVVKLALAGHDVDVEGGGAVHANEFVECFSISDGDTFTVDKLRESKSEGVLTVVLPDTSEMGFSGKENRLLVGVD